MTKDLRELSTHDVVDMLEELRDIATKRGTELLGLGRTRARRAVGAPGEGAVTTAFAWGLLLGAVVGAVVAMLAAPWPGTEARRRLSERADRVRERVAEARPRNDGRPDYERMAAAEEAGAEVAVP